MVEQVANYAHFMGCVLEVQSGILCLFRLVAILTRCALYARKTLWFRADCPGILIVN